MRGLLFTVLFLGACSTGADADGDGFSGADDCDDDNAAVHVGAEEICDAVDNDCDGGIDDADPEGAAGSGMLYADGDGDGYGGAELGRLCTAPAGSVLVGGDCDDTAGTISPDAAEICDGLDNDCDELVDDADSDVDLTTGTRFYLDGDADLYGSAAGFKDACTAPAGYVDDNTDCDDNDAARNPGQAEVCDGKDNNCDVASGLLVDDEDPLLDLASTTTFYPDADGDTYGATTGGVQRCTAPPNTVANNDDCDDASDAIRPGAAEVCDGVDNDCDGVADVGAWWNSAWKYRRVFTLTGGVTELEAPIVTLDFDGDALLRSVGDTSGLTPDAVRVVSQDCTAGQLEIPSEFIDSKVGLLSAGDDSSPLNDGEGTIVFRYDENGNLATRERLSKNEVRTYAVYFTSKAFSATAPTARPAITASAVTTTGPALTPNTVNIDNTLVTLKVDKATGGLTSVLKAAGKGSTGAQTSTIYGNGIYMAPVGGGPSGSWASATAGTNVSVTVPYKGSLTTIVDSSGQAGNASGSYRYTYRYIVFAGRQEVYTKVTYQLAQLSHIGPQPGSWSSAIRPYQVDNQPLLPGAGTRDAGFLYEQASYGSNTYGVWMGWMTPPIGLAPQVVDNTGRFLGLTGQDFVAAPGVTEINLPNSTTLLNGQVIMLWPYVGSTDGTRQTFLELMRPRNVVWGATSAFVP